MVGGSIVRFQQSGGLPSEPVALPPSGGGGGEPPIITINLDRPTDNHLLKYDQYLAQGMPGRFAVASSTKLREVRKHLLETLDGHVPESERPTDEQLSAFLSAFVVSQGYHAPPYTDFGIFGAHGATAEKLLDYQAQSLNSRGEFQRKLFRGPASYTEWVRCWRTFRACMIATGLAGSGALQTYEDGIYKLVGLYPGAWSVIGPLENRMREFGWRRIHEEALEEYQQYGELAVRGFVPRRPWDYVIR